MARKWMTVVLGYRHGYNGDVPIYAAVDVVPKYFAKRLSYAPFYVFPDGHTSIVTDKNSTK